MVEFLSLSPHMNVNIGGAFCLSFFIASLLPFLFFLPSFLSFVLSSLKRKMALGKSRSSRRSSSSSPYMSTVTMVVFIAFCVLGLWMITSKSVITPQTTTRTSNPFVSPTQTQTPTQTHSHYFPKLIERKEPPAFDDTQGDLPDDAIKGDNTEDHKPNEKKQPLETSKDDFNAQNAKQSVMPKLRDVVAETMTTSAEMEREGNVDSKINTGSTSATEEQKQEKEKVIISEENNPLIQQAKESVVEEEQQQQKQEPQVAEERNAIQQKQQQVEETLEYQQIPTNTNAETEENNGNKGKIQQQTVEVLGNNMQHQTHLQEPETAESSSVQHQTQQDTEIESNNNLHQNLQATEVGQSLQAIEVENNIIQKDPEVESHENSQQSQQLKSEEAHRQETQQDVTEETTSDEKKQEHTQQQQQKEIQEVTSDETQQQRLQPEIQEITSDDTQQIHQQQGSQEAQTTTIQQSQQQKTEKNTTAVENQKSQQTKGDIHTELNSAVIFPGEAQSVIPKESNTSAQAWLTQADQSENEKERQKEQSSANSKKKGAMYGYAWKLCNVTTGPDYIPCLDNEKAIRQLRYTGHFEHRERHCPEEAPTCLVPMPHGYKRSIVWPASRDKIWYHNVPHKMLAEVKGHQNWVKVTGEFLTFPGGGTQFIHGALHYIDFIQQSAPRIAWGKRTRVVLDVGCGVASFGGYLFERDVLTMSFAPKDEHEAQVQFALERGIPAISAVMGSKRLPFPSRVFDVVHCARCRVPWHREGGALLLELNRVLRPGGYFVWSATPVYQKLQEDVEIWKAMSSLTSSMCWELFTIKKDKVNSIGVAIFRKPFSNECYDSRKHKSPPMCKEDDDPNAAWNVPLQSCMHRVPVDVTERGSQWPENWPHRLHTPPYWLNSSQIGVYGKPAPDDFAVDYKHWKQVVSKSYLNGLGISWSNVRNVMDMRAVYGGFAAALKDLKVWVLNVVNVDSPDTLPIIYERGLFGIYHDWCESFSTYPRTYDLLHTDHLFSRLKKRCKIMPVMTEIDRIVRPGGKLIVRDEPSIVGEVENMLKSMHWKIHLTFARDQDGILSAQKSDWQPDTHSVSS